jgi:hypothetical protein
MMRMRAAIRGFLCHLFMLVALASPSLAQDGPLAAAEAAKTAHELRTYLAEIAQADGRPDYDRPPASQLVKTIFDADALAKLPISRNDKPWLTEWAAAASAALGAITQFGLQPGQPADEARLRRLRQNIDTDAYGSGLAFLIRIQSRFIAETERFANLHDPALDVVRERTAKTISDALVAMRFARASSAKVIATALRETDSAWIAFLSPNLRDEVLGHLQKTRAETHDRETSESLDAVSSDLMAAGRG